MLEEVLGRYLVCGIRGGLLIRRWGPQPHPLNPSGHNPGFDRFLSRLSGYLLCHRRDGDEEEHVRLLVGRHHDLLQLRLTLEPHLEFFHLGEKAG